MLLPQSTVSFAAHDASSITGRAKCVLSAHKTTISPREGFASTDSVAWRTAIPLRDLEDQTCGDHEGQIRPLYVKESI